MRLDDVMGFWWESITGPRMLADEIVSSLAEGKNVVLWTDGSLPWREQLWDFVGNHLGYVSPQSLDWPSGGSQDRVIPALLERLGRMEAYGCPLGFRDQVNYLKNEGVFANSVIWFVPRDSGDQAALLRFLSGYRGKGLEQHGAFVAEIPADQDRQPLSGGTASLRCGDYIRPNDQVLYANILADGIREIPRELKGYAACAAAGLADRDTDLIPDILREIDFQREDPAQAMERLWDEGYIPCPDRRPDAETLRQRVWKAQLQSAFALIEIERLGIVDEYADLIEDALSCEYFDPLEGRPEKQTGWVRQRGDRLEDAAGVELGTLVWMMCLFRSADREKPLLHFEERGLRSRIVFLKDCRNSLAHHRVCTPEQMCRLLMGE